MQLDPIHFWARLRPNAIALIESSDAGTRELSYGTFDAAINKIAMRLRNFDMPDMGVVAIQSKSIIFLYLIERALHRMNMTTLVLQPNILPDPSSGLLESDLFLTFEEANRSLHPKTEVLSTEWMREALTGPPVPAPKYHPRPQDILRILVSSGTTGKPKKIPLTRASLMHRFTLGAQIGYSGDERLLVTMGPETLAGFTAPLLCWSKGGCVIHINNNKIYTELLKMRPNNLLMSTGQLYNLINEIPENAKPIEGLRLSVMGSTLSKKIAEKAQEKITKDINIIYGSTELGAASFGSVGVLNINERSVGYIMPGLEVEIVNSTGIVLPPLEIGNVRIRREEVFSGYLDEEGITSSSWHDGWFYPGDLGALSEDGLLVILGRVSEIMNLGGVKIDPVMIDEFAKTIAGVCDAAAFTIPNEAGVELPWIAIVRGANFDAPQFSAIMQAKWPVLKNINLAFIDAIPRNGMMKIERQKFKQMAIAAQK